MLASLRDYPTNMVFMTDRTFFPGAAQAILEIRLHRLTAMEQTKLIDDYKGILEEIGSLQEILSNLS